MGARNMLAMWVSKICHPLALIIVITHCVIALSGCKLSAPESLIDARQTITTSPVPGTYYTSQVITFASNIPDTQICYKTDGTVPTCSTEGVCADGDVYTSPLPVGTALQKISVNYKIIGCKKDTITWPVASAEYNIDTTLPVLLSSTPANAVTNIQPNAPIVLVFSKRMATSFGAAITFGVWNGSSYATAPGTATFVFSKTHQTNDTITITPSWLQYPENTQIQFTIPMANLADEASNSIAADVQQSFTTTTLRQSFPVADTGQTACFDDTAGPGACPHAGALHPGQDADYVDIPNARSFTGPTAHATYTGDYTTTDNLTSLVWKGCTEGQSGATCTGGATTILWQNSLNQCAALNIANSGNGYAGLRTWRLSTQRELETLPNFGVAGPGINTVNFPGTQAQNYWSASTYAASANFAWFINFYHGSAFNNYNKGATQYVRCVASPATNNTMTYTDNGDGTVTDTITGLRWQKCSRGQNNDSTCSGSATTANWQTALQYCDALTLGSFGNSAAWRLPSVNELTSLSDKSRANPAIHTPNFPATVSANYWSSTTYAENSSIAWYFPFNHGGSYNSTNKSASGYTRCVSTGP